jgi:glutamate/tyrosine decarboxylase-like PLP-dependent enzyme
MVASVLDCDVLLVDGDEFGRLRAHDLAVALAAHRAQADGAPVFAISATAGTTNLGMVDDLAGLADVAEQRGPVVARRRCLRRRRGAVTVTGREALAGIDRVQSMVVDPHKWLFAGYDCCALLYRDVRIARAAFTQTAEYLEAVEVSADQWNPSDYAVHLTRRARGVPFWFSLAVHGTDAYRTAVDTCIETARAFTAAIEAASHLELFAPDHAVDRHVHPPWLGARRLPTLERPPTSRPATSSSRSASSAAPPAARVPGAPAHHAGRSATGHRLAGVVRALEGRVTGRPESAAAAAGRCSARWGG